MGELVHIIIGLLCGLSVCLTCGFGCYRMAGSKTKVFAGKKFKIKSNVDSIGINEIFWY